MEAVDFEPATDIPAEIGLTAAETEAVAAVMSDVVAFGTTIYSRYSAPSAAAAGYAPFLGVGHMQNVVLNDATWDPSTFEIETYLPTIGQVIEALGFNASVQGLTDFMSEGKKVMVWHGSADALLSENDTVRKWHEVREAAGDAVADDNSRLYVVPGVDHCGGGAGADTFDLLPAMIDWVEKDVAPGTIVASKIDRASGATLFTRPLCEYPAYPRYSGVGDTNDATSFNCVENTPTR
jgi:feruloyl esterase